MKNMMLVILMISMICCAGCAIKEKAAAAAWELWEKNKEKLAKKGADLGYKAGEKIVKKFLEGPAKDAADKIKSLYDKIANLAATVGVSDEKIAGLKKKLADALEKQKKEKEELIEKVLQIRREDYKSMTEFIAAAIKKNIEESRKPDGKPIPWSEILIYIGLALGAGAKGGHILGKKKGEKAANGNNSASSDSSTPSS